MDLLDLRSFLAGMGLILTICNECASYIHHTYPVNAPIYTVNKPYMSTVTQATDIVLHIAYCKPGLMPVLSWNILATSNTNPSLILAPKNVTPNGMPLSNPAGTLIPHKSNKLP